MYCYFLCKCSYLLLLSLQIFLIFNWVLLKFSQPVYQKLYIQFLLNLVVLKCQWNYFCYFVHIWLIQHLHDVLLKIWKKLNHIFWVNKNPFNWKHSLQVNIKSKPFLETVHSYIHLQIVFVDLRWSGNEGEFLDENDGLRWSKLVRLIEFRN